jgi:hypothetical protein
MGDFLKILHTFVMNSNVITTTSLGDAHKASKVNVME